MTAVAPDRVRRVVDRVALKASVFRRVGYEPHRGQRPIHSSKARHRVAACGRRFGKSFLGGNDLTVEALYTRLILAALEDRRREFWIVGPQYTDSEKEFRVTYNGLKKLGVPFDKPGTYNDPHGGDMQISLWGGKFLLLAKSAMHPERLVGEGLDGVVMAEAAKMKESTWTKFIRPTLADRQGWSLHTSSPEGKNWFYENWNRGQSELYEDWESWRRPSWFNKHVYPLGATDSGLRSLRHLLDQREVAVTETMMRDLGVDPEVGGLMRDLSSETFTAEIGAAFTEFVGLVFKDFDEEIHVRDFSYNPAWPVYAACDYGFTNPFVWLLIQVDPWGGVWVLDEMYERGLTIDEAAGEIVRRGMRPQSLREFFPDPASPGDTRALEKRLKIKSKRGTGGELKTRLRMIRSALKQRNTHLHPDHPDRQPKLYVNRRCSEIIREFGAYRYPHTAQEAAERGKEPTELPMKKDDHALEALGRFYAGMFNTPERAGGARVSEADLG